MRTVVISNSRIFKKLFINKDFFLLFSSAFINTFGNKLSIFAMPLIAIYLYNTDVMQTTLVTTISFLPSLLFSAHIGVIVDRGNKKLILIITNFISFILTLTVFFLAINSLLSLHLFYVYIFINNSMMLFSGLSFTSEMPLILDKKDLKGGNYRLELSNSFVQTLAPTLAGYLLKMFIAPILLLIDSLTFLVTVVLRLFISDVDKDSKKEKEQKESYWSHIKKSYIFVFNHEILSKMAFSYFIVVFAIGMFQSLQMFYLKQELSFSAVKIGYILSLGNVGLIIGSIICKKFSDYFGHGKTLILSLSLYSVCFLLYTFGSSYNYLPILISHIILGLVIPIYGLNMATIRQHVVDIKMLGSATAIWKLLGRGLIPIGATIAGFIASLITIRGALIVAFIIALIGVFPMLFSKDIRNYILE